MNVCPSTFNSPSSPSHGSAERLPPFSILIDHFPWNHQQLYKNLPSSGSLILQFVSGFPSIYICNSFLSLIGGTSLKSSLTSLICGLVWCNTIEFSMPQFCSMFENSLGSYRILRRPENFNYVLFPSSCKWEIYIYIYILLVCVYVCLRYPFLYRNVVVFKFTWEQAIWKRWK
jgi:hypothetical protein